MTPSEKAKRQYLNGKSRFNVRNDLILRPVEFPIYANGEVIGFIRLCEDEKLPQTLEIRNKVYNLKEK